jgi:glycosyltransferase involved in cell wall biosynthesis
MTTTRSSVDPAVSFVIPLYNRETLVGETLDSIIAQTRTDWECVVVDDGSTDGSIKIVEGYAEKDSRIRLFRRPADLAKGAQTCRNYGFENSTGTFVCFFDSDDLVSPEFLEVILRTLDKEPDIEYAAVPYDSFCESVSIRVRPSRTRFNPRRGTLFEQLMCDNVRSWTPNILWKRSFLETLPMLWREGLPCFQDPDFVRRSLCHAERGIWIEMLPAVHLRRDATSAGGIVSMSTKKPLDWAKTACFVHAAVYRHCVETGRMTDRLHRRYVRFLFNVFLFHSVVSNHPDVVGEFHELVVSHLEKTLYDRCLRVMTEIVFFGRPLFHGLGRFVGLLRPSFARKLALFNGGCAGVPAK